jgi:hypothetical protein
MFLTIGYDCSPAAALRELDLRTHALPFDWVVSSVESLERAFADDFLHFHSNLRLNEEKTRMIDEYGFEFPHDYPLEGHSRTESEMGEGMIGEEPGKCIVEHWRDYYPGVIEKYSRRIERLRLMLQSTETLIILCRYPLHIAPYVYDIIRRHSKSERLLMINSYNETRAESPIYHINTEQNGIWNEAAIWKQAIDQL